MIIIYIVIYTYSNLHIIIYIYILMGFSAPKSQDIIGMFDAGEETIGSSFLLVFLSMSV